MRRQCGAQYRADVQAVPRWGFARRAFNCSTRLSVIVLSLLAVTPCIALDLPLKEGDVVFLVSPSPQSDPILLATRSRYGHVGMILRHKGELMFFEAVSPVKYTPLNSWIRTQEGKHFVVKRLEHAAGLLTSRNLSRMESLASTMEGKPYDSWYNWSDEKFYCSELVWKIFQRILNVKLCDLRRMKDYDLTSPDVQRKLRERFPEGIPLEQMVVSPQDLFESPSLLTVYQQ